MSLAAPILIGAFFGSLFNQREPQVQQVPVAVVDLDGSTLSAQVLAALRADAALKLSTPDAATALDGVRRGSLRAVITLPAGFGNQALAALQGQADKPQLALAHDPSQNVVLPLLRGLLAQSLALTLSCGAAAAGLGFALALLRRPRRGRRDLVAALVLLPLAVPPVAYGALMLGAGRVLGLGPGPALTLLGLLPMRVALAYAGAVLAVGAVQREVIDSARDLGANAGARLLRVWLPLLAPAGAALGLVGFAHALAEGSVPAFTAGPGGSTLAVGMAIVARGGEIDVIPRWALGLSLAPVAAVWLSAWLWRRSTR
jgi:ABC-type spermidine/putrescine transport system permease subunit II